MSSTCATCNSPFCVCALIDGSADLTNLDGIFAALRRMLPPEAQQMISKLPPPDLVARLLIDPRSPLHAPHGEFVTWARRLHEAARDNPPSDKIDSDVLWRSFAEHTLSSGRQVLEALALIVEYNELLDEQDPSIAAHRAWMLDQVFRILAGDFYPSMRTTFSPTYSEGIEPIDPPQEQEPAGSAN